MITHFSQILLSLFQLLNQSFSFLYNNIIRMFPYLFMQIKQEKKTDRQIATVQTRIIKLRKTPKNAATSTYVSLASPASVKSYGSRAQCWRPSCWTPTESRRATSAPRPSAGSWRSEHSAETRAISSISPSLSETPASGLGTTTAPILDASRIGPTKTLRSAI